MILTPKFDENVLTINSLNLVKVLLPAVEVVGDRVRR